MKFNLDYDESNSRKKSSDPFSTHDWETKKIRKRAEKAAEEIMRKSRVREVLRESFKSARIEKKD